MDHNADDRLCARTEAYITGEIEVQLMQEVLDLNMADRINMDILAKIKSARGVVDRVTADIDGKLEVVFGLEKKAGDLANKATAPAIRALDSVAAELTEMVNALEGNGGPPLDGAKASTHSDGQSAEQQFGLINIYPTQPQS